MQASDLPLPLASSSFVICLCQRGGGGGGEGSLLKFFSSGQQAWQRGLEMGHVTRSDRSACSQGSWEPDRWSSAPPAGEEPELMFLQRSIKVASAGIPPPHTHYKVTLQPLPQPCQDALSPCLADGCPQCEHPCQPARALTPAPGSTLPPFNLMASGLNQE